MKSLDRNINNSTTTREFSYEYEGTNHYVLCIDVGEDRDDYTSVIKTIHEAEQLIDVLNHWIAEKKRRSSPTP